MRYLKGELYRVFHKKSSYIFTGAIGVLILIMLIIVKNQTPANMLTQSFAIAGNLLVETAAVVIISAFVFSLVYLDDFRGKTLSTTISSGQSRIGLVLNKGVLSAFITMVLYVVLGGLFFVFCAILGGGLGGEAAKNLLLSALSGYIKTVGYQLIAVVFVYLTQSPGLSLTIQLLLGSGFFQSILGLVLSLSAVKKIVGNLSPYLFANVMKKFSEGLNGGAMEWGTLLMVALYMVVPVALGAFVFTKKEIQY